MNLKKVKFRSFRNLVWLSLGVFAFLATSCKDPGEEEKKQEKVLIQSYISEKNITVTPTGTGLYYIEEVEGTGLSPVLGDFVQVRYSMRLIENETLLTTTDSIVAEDDDSYSEDKLYGPERIQLGSIISGLNEGLKMMKEGGEAKLIIPSSLAWGASYFGSIPPYTPIMIDVSLEKIIPDLPVYERDLLNQYLTDHGYSPADSTNSGIYVFTMEEGSGDSAQRFDDVKTYVKGSLSDGRMFLKDLDLRWTISRSTSSLITSGLNEGVDSMRVGEKALIIVPYAKGYGPGSINFFEDSRKAPIPPYSTLYYEVELLDIL